MAAYMLVEVAIHSPLLYEEYKKKRLLQASLCIKFTILIILRFLLIDMLMTKNNNICNTNTKYDTFTKKLPHG